MLTLVALSLRRARALLLSLAALLIAFETLLVAIAASIDGSTGFDRFALLAPSFVQRVFGPALSSFGGMALIGFFEPLIVMLVVEMAIYLATEPAADVETGMVDLILARPMPRHHLLTRSLVVMAAAAAVLPLLMGAALWVALAALAPAGAAWPDRHIATLLVAHLAASAWCFGGLGLVACGWARRRGAAMSSVGIGAVAFYLLDTIGDAWPRAPWLAWLSPFHCFHGASLVAGTGHPARDLSILVSLGAAGVAVAYTAFARRDV